MNACMDVLRGLREDGDLSQSDIANLIGTTQQQYSKYETGESELPLRALDTLADYYKVSADYLMGRTDCKEGVAGLNRRVSGERTAGGMITDVLSLSKAGRDAVLDYISLQILRKNCTCTKKKQ